MESPAIGSILLASTNPARLRDWYVRALGVSPDHDGFLALGEVAVLIDGRDDVADRAAEPARVILNVHVADAKETARRVDELGASWVAPLEYRAGAGAWFGTIEDPDGNYLQIIELTDAYWAAKEARAKDAAASA